MHDLTVPHRTRGHFRFARVSFLLVLDRPKALYFASFPDGPARQSWPGLVYVRVRPTWIRYSDYDQQPPRIVEFTAEALLISGT